MKIVTAHSFVLAWVSMALHILVSKFRIRIHTSWPLSEWYPHRMDFSIEVWAKD